MTQLACVRQHRECDPFTCEMVSIDSENYVCVPSGNYHRCTEDACQYVIAPMEGDMYCPLTSKRFTSLANDVRDEDGCKLIKDRERRGKRTGTETDAAWLSNDDARRRMATCISRIEYMRTHRSAPTTNFPPPRRALRGTGSDGQPRKRKRSNGKKHKENARLGLDQLFAEARGFVQAVLSAREPLTDRLLYKFSHETYMYACEQCVRLRDLVKRAVDEGNDDDAAAPGSDDGDQGAYSRGVDYRHLCMFVICHCLRHGLVVLDETIIRPATVSSDEALPDRKALPLLSINQSTYTRTEKLIRMLLLRQQRSNRNSDADDSSSTPPSSPPTGTALATIDIQPKRRKLDNLANFSRS